MRITVKAKNTQVTEPLTDTLTLAGPIEVELMTAISSTDADFMVKVIDVYPERFKYPLLEKSKQ